jgi:hypothetical protein
MVTDLLLALLTLAALFVPLVFAWWVLSRTARRHAHRRKGGSMR